jgi:hypothetical protein
LVKIFFALSDDDAERERIRGIFVIGAVAVLYYLRATNSNAPLQISLGVTTDDILRLLAGYVVLTAFALLVPQQPTIFPRVSRPFSMIAYAFAKVFLSIAVAVSILAVIQDFYRYFVPPIIHDPKVATLVGILIAVWAYIRRKELIEWLKRIWRSSIRSQPPTPSLIPEGKIANQTYGENR